MTAGLLICDHVNSKYQDQFGDYPLMFAKLFPEFSWKHYDVCNGEFPTDLEQCDLYLATGSLHSVYDDLDWIRQLKQLVRQIADEGKYFVGFCFGHQLLGEAMGGKVKKSPNGWCVGVHEFEISDTQSWMQPQQDSINLLMMCQDQVIELPPNAKVLGGNEKCPVAIMQIGENLLGIQSHPEFSKAYDRFLMESRIQTMGKEVVEAGLESLEKEIHRELVRKWILNFLKL